ncbi:hypothetical protein [Streptomyces sp. NBC_01500]|uniref:hypothetical protein n=1 Tax=Streptomyces sp. NBC_01500 TaxID=2903886 RepID=UPI00224DD99E|nr:hypothetical protein [Streptomyces sp. NBC_01500]MCX4550517.1 hypothetical protein [Streptomyces sp. NBC_01500]
MGTRGDGRVAEARKWYRRVADAGSIHAADALAQLDSGSAPGRDAADGDRPV